MRSRSELSGLRPRDASASMTPEGSQCYCTEITIAAHIFTPSIILNYKSSIIENLKWIVSRIIRIKFTLNTLHLLCRKNRQIDREEYRRIETFLDFAKIKHAILIKNRQFLIVMCIVYIICYILYIFFANLNWLQLFNIIFTIIFIILLF